MRVEVLGASAHWNDWREEWTLELSVRGPFRTRVEMGPEEWKSLLPQLRGRVRHRPVSEADAERAASVVEDLLREPTCSIAIDTEKFGNINVKGWGWKEKGLKKPTKEEKRMTEKAKTRTLELKLTVGRGTRTAARCHWDVLRTGEALAAGLVAKDSEGAEAITGTKVLRYETKEVPFDELQEDGTTKQVTKKVREPVWDDTEQPIGPFRGPLPDPKNGYGEHIAFIPEVRDIFKKAKKGKPFRVMDFGKDSIKLYIDDAIDIESAQPFVDEAFERLPWCSEYMGSKLSEELFK